MIRLPHTATPNTILGREAIIAAQNVFFVMNECRRLRSALEIFPSDAARKEFFKQLSLISKAMRELKEAHLWMDMDPVAWQKSLYNSWTWTELHRNRSDFFFPESLTGRVPFWHPLNIGQNIWNKWLENRCRYEIPGTENKIIQRLPDLALRISHRTKFMYNIVERSYEQVSKHSLQKDPESIPNMS